jgi:TBCC domain-containing protein 1
METFEHLGFLVQFSEGTALSQAATFFANSDSDMPAAPVPASQILDWMSHHITLSLEYSTERSAAKESSQQIDTDVTMTDANTSQQRNSTPSTSPSYYRSTTFVEGFSKTSVIKHAADVKGHSMKVSVTNSFLSVPYYLIMMSYRRNLFCM